MGLCFFCHRMGRGHFQLHEHSDFVPKFPRIGANFPRHSSVQTLSWLPASFTLKLPETWSPVPSQTHSAPAHPAPPTQASFSRSKSPTYFRSLLKHSLVLPSVWNTFLLKLLLTFFLLSFRPLLKYHFP